VNRYRVLLPLVVHTEDGSYGQGDEFDKDFTVEEESANLASGLIEIVPRDYRVIGESVVLGAQPGEVFAAAIPKGQEELLLGAHLERVDPEPVEQPKPKRKPRSRPPESDKG
jgi:hypothetical protein